MISSIYKKQKAVDRVSIASINKSVNGVLSSKDMAAGLINKNTMLQNSAAEPEQKNDVQQPVSAMTIPQLCNNVRKGQKVPLNIPTTQKLDICIGWNVNNPDCDIDFSAFLLDGSGKVIGDDWFVFYSQTDSPDGSVHFSAQSQFDREEIAVDLSRLSKSVQKIVFVLTIYDAAKKGMNFSMVSDAYIRILDNASKQEIVSFKMDEYYPNVLSMMIGELYLHNGAWKSNAVGNGIAKELDGLCELYGVQLI